MLSRFHWGAQVEITLLSVITIDIYPEMTSYEKPVEFLQQERQEADKALDRAAAQLQSSGATIRRELREADSVADEIVATAESMGADLVVLGHRGLNRIERFFRTLHRPVWLREVVLRVALELVQTML